MIHDVILILIAACVAQIPAVSIWLTKKIITPVETEASILKTDLKGKV